MSDPPMPARGRVPVEASPKRVHAQLVAAGAGRHSPSRVEVIDLRIDGTALERPHTQFS